MGRQCGGGCFTCMKYNTMLLHARSEGLPDNRWADFVLPPLGMKSAGRRTSVRG